MPKILFYILAQHGWAEWLRSFWNSRYRTNTQFALPPGSDFPSIYKQLRKIIVSFINLIRGFTQGFGILAMVLTVVDRFILIQKKWKNEKKILFLRSKVIVTDYYGIGQRWIIGMISKKHFNYKQDARWPTGCFPPQTVLLHYELEAQNKPMNCRNPIEFEGKKVLTLFDCPYLIFSKTKNRFKNTLSTELFCCWTKWISVPNLPNIYMFINTKSHWNFQKRNVFEFFGSLWPSF